MSVIATGQTTPRAVRRTPRMVDEAGVRLGLAHAALGLAVVLLASLPMSTAASLLLVGALVLGAARHLPAAGAALVAVSAWACWTGFAEHRDGVLTLAGGDLTRLGVLVVLALAVSLGLGAHRE